MVLVRVGVEYAQRMLRGSDVAPQYQIQLVQLSPASGNGSDGVVGFSVREGHNAHGFVGIAPPADKNFVRQLGKPYRVFAVQTDDAHRPLHNPRVDILIASEGDFRFQARAFHGKAVMTALKVLMAQDGAAHNGQIGVGADEIMRKCLHKIQ